MCFILERLITVDSPQRMMYSFPNVSLYSVPFAAGQTGPGEGLGVEEPVLVAVAVDNTVSWLDSPADVAVLCAVELDDCRFAVEMLEDTSCSELDMGTEEDSGEPELIEVRTFISEDGICVDALDEAGDPEEVVRDADCKATLVLGRVPPLLCWYAKITSSSQVKMSAKDPNECLDYVQTPIA